MATDTFVDIHCHLVPAVDDGAQDLPTALAMARMAVADGTATIICTPHQLGAYAHNNGDSIRSAVKQLQQALQQESISLCVLPGADVRIEPKMVPLLRDGQVLTLGDHGRHVLLELPHELYMPMEPVLDQLDSCTMTGILSHPERNLGIQRRPEVVRELVRGGCLMQLTAGSLLGTFGPRVQRLSISLVEQGLIHFVATDAHGVKARRPLLRRAYEFLAEQVGVDCADQLCCENPNRVASGHDVQPGVQSAIKRRARSWFGRRKVG